MSNFNELSKSDQERALKLLKKADEQKMKDLRYNTKNRLMLIKAHKANIVVTDAEVDEELKRTGKM